MFEKKAQALLDSGLNKVVQAEALLDQVITIHGRLLLADGEKARYLALEAKDTLKTHLRTIAPYCRLRNGTPELSSEETHPLDLLAIGPEDPVQLIHLLACAPHELINMLEMKGDKYTAQLARSEIRKAFEEAAERLKDVQ